MTSEEPAPAPQPKPQRPRDELGRPLPRGSANRLELEDFDALGLQDNHRLGVNYFDEQQFFGAHEAWESCWKWSPSEVRAFRKPGSIFRICL